jgi:hypothetical protein
MLPRSRWADHVFFHFQHYYDTTPDPTDGAKVVQILETNVRPVLILRVKTANRTKPYALYHNLRQLCKPFRLLDLSAEYRAPIFELVMHDSPSTIHPADHRSVLRVTPLAFSSLCLTSKQIRQEAAPTHFSRAKSYAAGDRGWVHHRGASSCPGSAEPPFLHAAT